VEADDETSSLFLDRLDVDQRTPHAGTILGEIGRLTADYMPLTVHEGVADRVMRRTAEYDDNRLATIASLAASIGATYRAAPDGSLEIIPAAGVEADWFVAPGVGGTMSALAAVTDDHQLANAVTSHTTLDDETRLIGRARLDTGPLAYGGPFGRVRVFRGANLATTQDQVEADAATTLAGLSERGDVYLTATTLAHPGLQIGDLIPLTIPGEATIPARVAGTTLTVTGGVVNKHMTCTLAVSHDDFYGATP
jgi:hypothetical protein